MPSLRRWAASQPRRRLLPLLIAGAAMAVALNVTCRSRVWAYDEALTPAAIRQEQADLDTRAGRAARREYTRLTGIPVPTQVSAALEDTLARLEAAERAAGSELLAARQAGLRRTARLLHAGEAASWLILLLLLYVGWSHATAQRHESEPS